MALPWFLAFAGLAGGLERGYRATAQHVSELTTQPGTPHTLVSVAALGSP